MITKYISAANINQAIDKMQFENEDDRVMTKTTINNIPAADVEKVIYAHWKKTKVFTPKDGKIQDCYKCSNCELLVGTNELNSCPNCNAHMHNKNKLIEKEETTPAKLQNFEDIGAQRNAYIFPYDFDTPIFLISCGEILSAKIVHFEITKDGISYIRAAINNKHSSGLILKDIKYEIFKKTAFCTETAALKALKMNENA